MNSTSRADDSGVGPRLPRSDAFDPASQAAPEAGTEFRELALDALFGQDAAARPPTDAADATTEADFEDHLGRLEPKVKAPANDDRADAPDGRTRSPARSRTRLRHLARSIVVASLLLLACGLATQLDLGTPGRIGRAALWPVAIVDLLLILAFLSGLADLTFESNRRRDGERRDDAERAARRDKAMGGALELLRTQAFDFAADVAQLRVELAVLAAMPRLEPTHFALFATKIDAQFARLASRVSEQKTASEQTIRREEGLIAATARLDQRTQDMARDVAELRIELGDIASAPKLEPSHFAIFYDGIETKLGALADRMAEHEAAVVGTIAGLDRGAAEPPAREIVAHAHDEAPDDEAPNDRVGGRLESFCDGLAVFLDDAPSLSDEQRSLLEGASLTLDMMFNIDALMQAWDAYRSEGRADFRSAYRPDFLFLMLAVRRRLDDEAFAASVVAYCEDYETVLTAAGQSASDAAFLRALCNRRGRCYTLLAHALGRIASVEAAEASMADAI